MLQLKEESNNQYNFIGDFDLFLLAGRYTLLEQEALHSFLPLCEKRGIGIITGGPYNSGILATGATPAAFYNYDKAPKVCKRYCGTNQEFKGIIE